LASLGDDAWKKKEEEKKKDKKDEVKIIFVNFIA
jgi:hypothetical protein